MFDKPTLFNIYSNIILMYLTPKYNIQREILYTSEGRIAFISSGISQTWRLRELGIFCLKVMY